MKSDSHLALVTCSIDMHFSSGDAEHAIRLLLSSVERTEAKPKCRACTVLRDASDGCRVRYSESWISKTAFEQHVLSEEFRRVLVAMDMCCEEPQVVIGNLSGHSGISYLRELREGIGKDVE